MTERAFSPESAKATTSNSRMGEFVLLISQESIPKPTSYLQVARSRMDFFKARQDYGESSEEALLASDRYDEYLSRMDPDEKGLMAMEYNRLVNAFVESKAD